MAKNLSPNDSSGGITAYKPVNFDENAVKREKSKALNPDEIKAQAYEKGYKEGFEKGSADGYAQALQDGQAAIDDSLIRLSSIISEIERFKERKLNDMFPLFLELSKDMAEKIVRKKIEIDSDIVLSVTGDAVKKIEQSEDRVVIKVNPADYEIIIENLASLKEQSGARNVLIETSPSISQGGCYIETATGEIDATIETQIKEVNNAVSTAADTEV